MSLFETAINTSSDMAETIWETVGMEVTLFALFSFGFILFRSDKLQMFLAPAKGKKVMDGNVEISEPDALRLKQLEASFTSGQFENVLNSWPELQHFTVETMKMVMRSVIELPRHTQMKEVLHKMLDEHSSLCTSSTMNAALALVPTNNISLLVQIYEAFDGMGVPSNDATFESILGAMKDAAPERIAEVCMQMKIKMTARTYSVLVKNALKSKRIDRALKLLSAMHDAGHAIPPSCLASILRTAGDMDCMKQAMKMVPANITYSPEATAVVLEHAQKSNDLDLLNRTHREALDKKIELTYSSYDALIKAYASQGDSKAIKLFDEMLSKGFDPAEGSLISIIALCADSKHVQMAEHAVDYCHQKGRSSLAMYSALMKVYVASRLFDKTCDLYEQITKDGLELDTVAYGCLIKAAVEGGRLELARKLFTASGNPDLLNYMSLIRAAGREKNSKKALTLLRELEESPIEVDTTAYNCVLGVCVACGDRASANILFERMKAKDNIDVISYNTQLKGLTAAGSWAQVEVTLEEMRARNLKPNVVTYNSLINAAIVKGDLSSAWRFLEDMEANGVAMDAFTCSIMMKGLKHSQRKDDVDKILSVMDRAKVVPDEVLVNSMLAACVRLRDPQRLSRALDQFKASGVVPSMHAYAVLIKAYGHANRIDQARKVWNEITVERNMVPNEEVYGCIIDASVSNDDLEGAMKLFIEMKTVIPDYSKSANIFSTLIRGFMRKKEMHRAMELYEELRKGSMTFDLITYNTLIDACARVGEMTKASALFRDMCENGVDPDLITYSTVVKGYCCQGDMEQAIQLFTLMRKRNIKPDAILFNSILDGCARKQMRTLTEQIFSDMEDAGIAPSNFTLSILIKLYGRCRDVNRAFEVVETLPKKYGFDINATVYTCLMSTCITNGTLDKALNVFKSMKLSKCAADAKTYQTLINGCVKLGNLEEAVELLDDALDLKGQSTAPRLQLESETIETVLFMISRRQKSEEMGAPLLERLRKAGIEVSKRAGNSASRAAPQNVGTSSRFHSRRNNGK